MSVVNLGIAFRPIGNIYYKETQGTDKNGEIYEIGQGIIVETQRGLEYGEIVEKQMNKFNGEKDPYIKKIIRTYDDSDLKTLEENYKKAALAHQKIKELVKKHNLNMKILDTEYLFDSTKAIFTFSARNRVDFRDLLKELASELKVKIELKQVGPRDEAKLLGGLGACGSVACCANHLRNFNKVSIRMAKCQNISLSQENINGLCNRLKCCIQHEYSNYKEVSKLMPDINSQVVTPEGKGKVIYNDLLRKRVTVRINTSGETIVKKFELEELK